MDTGLLRVGHILHRFLLTLELSLLIFTLGISIAAKLTSFLARPQLPDFFHSVDELVRQGDIQWIVEDGSAWVNMGEDAE